MQQTVFIGTQAQERRSLNVGATIRRSVNAINGWLDAKSAVYSRICEFSVTRRMVIRVNLITLCVIVGASAVESSPLAALTAMACGGYLVYRLNKEEKGGKA